MADDLMLRSLDTKSIPVISGLDAGRFLLSFATRPVRTALDYQSRYGTAMILRPSPVSGSDGRRFYVTADPSAAEKILNDPEQFKTVGIALTRGPKDSAQRRLRNGMVRMNGPHQRALRRAYAPALSLKQLSAYRTRLDRICAEQLARWPKDLDFDAFQLSIEFAHKAAAELLFGAEESELAARIGDLIWQHSQMQYSLNTFLFPVDAPGTPYRKLLRHAEATEHALVDWLRQSSGDEDDLVSRISRLSEIDELGRAAQLWTLYGASFETTATALRWTLLHIAWNPEVQDRLRSTIHDRPDDTSFIDAVISESMRLSTPGPFQLRRLHEDTTFEGVHLRRNDHVVINAAAINRDPLSYEKPGLFLPDRWETLQQSPMMPLAFSAGPRMCLGVHFSRLVMRTFIIHLFRSAKILVPEASRIDLKLANTQGPTSLPLRLTPLSDPTQRSRFIGHARDQMSGMRND